RQHLGRGHRQPSTQVVISDTKNAMLSAVSLLCYESRPLNIMAASFMVAAASNLTSATLVARLYPCAMT
ncbi:MAG: hypothetical protein L0K36_00335, partial [Lactiplantibacillus plantarum]|nr:hypothetical protein [Lactiplantibacillus plantarum]